jgi:ATP-dependent DNA helicase RecQ
LKSKWGTIRSCDWHQQAAQSCEASAKYRSIASGASMLRTSATPALSADEKGLFEDLRLLRRDIAAAKGVPPYVVFGDVTLEELARVRPSTVDNLLGVRGIGNIKLQEFGHAFIERIGAYCSTHGLSLDAGGGTRKRSFERGMPLTDVAAEIKLSVGTASEYLCTWIELTKPASIEAWVDAKTYAAVETALDELGKGGGGTKLRPIWEQLEGKVTYEQIKAIIAHLRANV